MGWSNGSQLLDEVFEVIKHYTNKTDREIIASQLIEIFENYDCDTIHESDHSEILRAYRALYPEYFEDETN